MEHVLTYRNFSNKYENFNISDLSIESFDEVFDNLEMFEGKFKLFKKLKTWAISPKVKKLQKKANAARIKGVKEEVSIKKKTMDALNKNKESVDLERVKQILTKKYAATEKIARAYEDEAAAIVNGNEYLMKVMRVEALKGTIAENDLRLSIADGEEEEALNDINNEAAKLIRDDIGDIKSKMQDPTYESPEAKDASSHKNDTAEPINVTWQELKDNTGLTYDEKITILKAKYKYTKSDNDRIRNFKRAWLAKEQKWIKGTSTKSSFHDKEDIEAANFDKLVDAGINLNQTEFDKYQEDALKKKKGKK